VTTQEREVRDKLPRAADPAGNQRLTAMTGAVLLALVIAECLTLLRSGVALFITGVLVPVRARTFSG
jgi:hypothetical protein